MDDPAPPSLSDSDADPQWFRQPTRREHWIAFALFLGFGVFFALLFWVTAGWWFRWVTLGLGVWSVLYAFGHARDAKAEGRRQKAEG